MSGKKKDRELECSFCNRSNEEISSLVAGQDVFICNHCIADAQVILDETEKQQLSPKRSSKDRKRQRPKLLLPNQIKEELDKYVIGQEYAKKNLAVAVYNHYKRIDSDRFVTNYKDVEIEKSNILLLGESGTGKTLLARTLARILHVPFSISDATALTEAGYVGEDVENILSNLLSASDFEVKEAERGIIFIDEIDKVARKGHNVSITRDVSGEGVQQGLLKVLEGTVAGVPPKGGRKHPEQSLVNIDTSGILFICGGAFDGLSNIISRRRNVNHMGFTPKSIRREEDINVLQFVEPEDLIQYGLIPELIGRLPITAALGSLSEEEMMRILTEPKNAIVRQYQKLFALDGVDLVFDEAALRCVVQRAKAMKTGARGLRSILEESMLDIMFDAHSMKNAGTCYITEKTISLGTPPIYKKRKASA